MRIFSRNVLATAVALLMANLASAQIPGLGGLGLGGGMDPAALLRNPQVKKEIELSDEQAKKIPDAIMKALGEVLDANQMKRLRQIEIQMKGAQAFTDEKVQEKLRMTEKQKEKITEIMEESKQG